MPVGLLTIGFLPCWRTEHDARLPVTGQLRVRDSRAPAACGSGYYSHDRVVRVSPGPSGRRTSVSPRLAGALSAHSQRTGEGLVDGSSGVPDRASPWLVDRAAR